MKKIKTYKLTVRQTYEFTHFIEAESKEQALEKYRNEFYELELEESCDANSYDDESEEIKIVEVKE